MQNPLSDFQNGGWLMFAKSRAFFCSPGFHFLIQKLKLFHNVVKLVVLLQKIQVQANEIWRCPVSSPAFLCANIVLLSLLLNSSYLKLTKMMSARKPHLPLSYLFRGL